MRVDVHCDHSIKNLIYGDRWINQITTRSILKKAWRAGRPYEDEAADEGAHRHADVMQRVGNIIP
jgi:hypothetical protein